MKRVESPRSLALLRIVVPLIIVCSPELHQATSLAASPERLGFVPEGLGLVARALPLGPDVARVLQIIAFSSAATAILGFASRASMLVLTLSAGLLFSLSQRQGAVIHDMHLLWFTALLAASPCGAAWSLDAWGKVEPSPSARFGVPLTFARLLLGLVYFFPWVHKLRVSGLAWISADNVIGHMRAKWLEQAHVPVVRIDQVPALCAIGALFVVLFELSFVFLALGAPKTRWIALGAGLLFHALTQVLFFIPFVSLWACYVVLVDGRRLDKRTPENANASRSSIIVGAVLAFAVFVQGARAMTQAWPFACYPTFSHIQPSAIPDLVVEITRMDGTVTRLTGREDGRVRSQDDWGRVFRLYADDDAAVDDRALRDHARRVITGAGIALTDVASARIYRVEVKTAPEKWADPPSNSTLLKELPGPL